jgi:hypothetical protein
MRRFLLNIIVFTLLLPQYILWIISWLYDCLLELIIKLLVNGKKVEPYKLFDEIDTRMNNLKHLL